MAGNSQRRGATRKTGSKKGMQKGSGGQRRRGLEPKGPTPKAEDRTYHAAYKRKVLADKKAAVDTARETSRSKRNAVKISDGNELVVGRNPVSEAVKAGVPVERVYLATSVTDERVASVVQAAAAAGAPIIEVSRLDLDEATDGQVHQGVAIEIRSYEYNDLESLWQVAADKGRNPLLVALDSVTDPHNLGAVLRSAGAFGADGVIITRRRSASVNATVWKVSAGAVARVPVAQETNLVRTLEKCKKEGLFVVGLDGQSSQTISELELVNEPLVLVTGAEGAGLSRLVRETCDLVVSIPISSAVESLNAAVATGIALYEVTRQRQI